MQAIVYSAYGPPEGLRLAEVETPVPADNQVLVKVCAVSINGSDKEKLLGRPLYARLGGLRRPGHPILGSDIAGTVVAVGQDHTEFQPGDAVFGELPGYRGGFAEYVCTAGKTLLPKPAALSWEQAAALPQAGAIALHGIVEQGALQPGQSVLINGAGGSGGSFAVQLARQHGATVTGVDNRHKLDFIRALGADHAIDYAAEDFTRGSARYDLILDLVAHRSLFALQRALRPGGTYFFTGGSVAVMAQVLLLGPLIARTTGKSMRLLAVPQSRELLRAVTALCVAGTITPAIDRIYALADVPEAMRYVVSGRARGKVVIAVADDAA